MNRRPHQNPIYFGTAPRAPAVCGFEGSKPSRRSRFDTSEPRPFRSLGAAERSIEKGIAEIGPLGLVPSKRCRVGIRCGDDEELTFLSLIVRCVPKLGSPPERLGRGGPGWPIHPPGPGVPMKNSSDYRTFRMPIVAARSQDLRRTADASEYGGNRHEHIGMPSYRIYFRATATIFRPRPDISSARPSRGPDRDPFAPAFRVRGSW
jgi:hypothetical protein